jgi:TetR/AcrR family transcriptional repressor of mexJK operon
VKQASRGGSGTAQAGPVLREGSAQKRSAILGSARELFLANGFERTSVDAIAASAGVSKRTVYDYYGDKRTLLLAVVEQAVDALLEAVDAALRDNLTDVDKPAQLEPALVAFAQSLTTSALGSADYTALIRLTTMESGNLPELRDHEGTEPEETLAARFAEFGALGLLEVPKPRVAADHFVALTLIPSANTLGFTTTLDELETTEMIAEGVAAFLRAYARK